MAATASIASAVVGVGGSLLSSSKQSSAASDASKTQLAMYNQTRADLAPFASAGQGALTQLQALLGIGGNSASQLQALQNTPGYQFTRDQGVQALDRSAASRGLVLSGGQLKDVTAYGQGLASTTFNTAVQQAQNLSQLGENAAAMTGQQGTVAAANAGQAMQNAGTASASGIAGATNQLSGLLNNANLVGAFSGGGGGGSALAQGIGGADPYFLATGGIESDRRLKTDIRRVGKTESGLSVYSYRLKSEGKTRFGVMSDEVRKVAPHAVRRAADGFDRVDYDAVSKLPPMKRAA